MKAKTDNDNLNRKKDAMNKEQGNSSVGHIKDCVVGKLQQRTHYNNTA